MIKFNSPKDFVKEICQEQNIKFETLSYEYIMRLTKGSVVRHVIGSKWDVNNAAACRIACDKSACYAVLKHSGVPAIPHELLMHPIKRQGFIGEKGTWLQALKFFGNSNSKVVVKPNHGTNGQDVLLCDSVQTLESAVHTVFADSPNAAISPFYDIKTEYRVFHVNGTCPLVYGKAANPENWRHNLSQGATAFEVADENILATLKTLASRAATAIGIHFATIDIVETISGDYLIMEINSGVQARQLLEQLPYLRPVVKGIYESAVLNMFKREAFT